MATFSGPKVRQIWNQKLAIQLQIQSLNKSKKELEMLLEEALGERDELPFGALALRRKVVLVKAHTVAEHQRVSIVLEAK